MQEEDLAAIEIEVCLIAVEANLGGGLTKIVIGVVVFIISAIKIIEEFIVFIGYKASKLEVFGVTVAITKKVRKSIKIIGQQW